MKPIRIIGIPTDLGQSLRGVDMGPGALRYAGLRAHLRQLGRVVEDAGNITPPVRDAIAGDEPPYFLDETVRLCERIYEAARTAIADGCIPIFLGGDHSISIGTVGGVTHESPVGVLWVDAHGDFNTPETSPSGNVHGMALAALLGHGPKSLVDLGRPGPKLRVQDVVMIAVRDLDPGEKRLLRESGIAVYTMRQIDERGIASVAREALERLKHVSRLHLSLDLDCLDPSEAPGVGTPVHGGLSYREAQLLMEMLCDADRVSSMDVVEVNPILDARNETAITAVELVESVFGKAIL